MHCFLAENSEIEMYEQHSLFQMNLGDGPRFIAVEVDLAMTNKLKNGLVGKFHLSNDFFKQGSQDPSQRYIVFRLAGSIYAQDVANIHEVGHKWLFFMQIYI